jgi:PKD repeat protein
VLIGEAPVAATFSADQSISGVAGATTPAAITNYAWTFGDGGTGTGQAPSHTFTSGGDKTVTLTVTNSDGNTNSYSRVYRVAGTVTGEVPPSAPTNLRLRN